MGLMTGFRIYAFDKLNRVPEGRVVTVPDLARWAGAPGARDGTKRVLNLSEARSHPYWRVVEEDGSLLKTIGGGPDHQREKLEEEGVPLRDETHVDLDRCRFRIEEAEEEEE